MSNDIDRRTFIARSVMLGASYPLLRRGQRAAPALRVGVSALHQPPTDPRAMGLTLGAEEATHAAALFGGSFALVAIPDESKATTGLTAIIGDADCGRTRKLGSMAAAAGLPFLNIGCSDDALRGAQCGRTVFHIAPSEAMRRDARRSAHAEGDVVAWHPTLVRFGADTLNRRFKERFGTPMTSDAWTAWLATKILWESALRLQSSEPSAMLQFLTRETTQFDGHKGLPLSFRTWDRQLRQPLYVLAKERVVEVPVASRPGEPARALLDQLGNTKVTSACREPS